MLKFLILMVGAILGVMVSAEARLHATGPDRASHPLSSCIHNV